METLDIYFYGRTKGRVNGKYRFLSNFYKSPFIIDGKEYMTVEHYFQSMKFKGDAFEEIIRKAPDPKTAKKTAWEKNAPQNWELIKEQIMLKALRAKFMQNKDLAKKLVKTGNARLHEDSPYDEYWGAKGKDRLGKLLMQIRDELQKGILLNE